MLWFTKSRRAQNVDDYETWVEGGVMPTLNAFDNGDVRTTVIVFHPHYHDGARVQGDTMNTLTSRMGTGGNNVSMVATLVRMREGKPGGGKGPLLSEDKSLTIATNNDQTLFVFSHTQGLDPQASEEASPTLRANGNGMAVAYSPSDFANYNEGVGTLKAGMTNNNSPLVAFDAYNHTTSETNQTLRTGSDLDKMGTVYVESSVRRLTPVECERLQGFPDGWTEGQSDSTRYKQMGNAVAVPVVDWIIEGIVATL